MKMLKKRGKCANLFKAKSVKNVDIITFLQSICNLFIYSDFIIL